MGMWKSSATRKMGVFIVGQGGEFWIRNHSTKHSSELGNNGASLGGEGEVGS